MFRSKADHAVASVDDISDTGEFCPGFVCEGNDLLDRTTGGYHILNDKDSFIGKHLQPPSDLHRAVFSFGENRTNTQRSSDFRSDNNAADCRRNDNLDFIVFEMSCNFSCEKLQILRILEHAGTLEIVGTVEAGGQLKMTFQQSFCFPEDAENFLVREFGGHINPSGYCGKPR